MNEVETLKSVKIQFGLVVGFYMIRDEKLQQTEHYFNRMQPAILNEHNVDTLNHLLNQFIDEVKGEIDRGLVSKGLGLDNGRNFGSFY